MVRVLQWPSPEDVGTLMPRKEGGGSCEPIGGAVGKGDPATRRCFLDTSVFVSHKFDYTSPGFRRFVELAEAGLIKPYTTSVTEREILAQIRRAVGAARTAAKKFRKDAAVLAEQRFPEFTDVFKRLDTADLERRVLDKYQSFAERCGTSQLPVEGASIHDIFDDYFEERAPFSEGKKKSEFPDAFVVSALQEWCADRGDEMDVVSEDVGFRQACDLDGNLRSFEALEAYLDEVVSAQNLPLALRITNTFRQASRDVEKQVRDSFKHLGFWLEEEGEVWAVEVEEVEILRRYLIELAEDWAQFDLITRISFSVEISYEDQDSGVWDSEDKIWLFRESIDTSVERTEEFPVEVRVLFDPDDPEVLEIEEVIVNGGRDISVSRYEDWTEEFYK